LNEKKGKNRMKLQSDEIRQVAVFLR
jgi:hypothetical protein